MFRRSRTARNGRMATHKRRLLTEALEDRRLLAFTAPLGGEPSHVFAVAQGTINNPGDTVVETLDTSAYTMPRRAAVLGFEVEGSAGLNPDAVQVSGPGVLSYHVVPNIDGSNTNSLVLARVGSGSVDVTIGGEGGTTGDFSVEVFLPGDDNGDRDVDLSDLQTFPIRLGSSVGDITYAVEVDANLDGMIARNDMSPQRLNFGVTVVEPPPLGNAPVANDDDPAGTPAFVVNSGDILTIADGAGDIVERNDIVGSPAATITSFGGGSLGGSVIDNFAGTTVPTGAGGTLQVNPDGSFTLVTDTSQDGLFTFDYRLENAFGSSDATVTVDIVDNIPPSLLITSPVAGQDVAIGSTVPFTANASDNIGIASVEFIVDGTSIFTDTVAPYETSFVVQTAIVALPIEAIATDVNGNQTSQSFTVDPVDLTPPDVTITSPLNGDIVSMGSTVSFNAHVVDNVGVTRADFYVDGNLIFSDTSAPYATSFTAPTTPSPLDLQVIGFDDAGNTSSDLISVILSDDTPPSVSLTAPSDGLTLIEGTAFNATANASDNIGVTAVEFFVGGSSIGIDNSAPYEVPFTVPNTLGTVPVFARAFDAAGNAADSPTNNIDVIPDLPPTVSIIAPNDGDNILEGSTVTFSASAGDDIGVTQVEFFVDGTSIFIDNTAPFTTSFTLPASPSPLALQAVATDTAGQTTPDTITVNIIPNSPPTASPDSYDAVGNVGISVPAPGVLSNDTIAGGTITAFDNTSTGGGTVSVAADGSFTYEPAPGFEGTGAFADTFTYTLENGAGPSVGTVSIDVNNLIWFIDNTAGGANDGTLANPFQSISDFNGAAGVDAGDDIFLYDATYNEADGINLQNDQRLIGQGTTGASLQAILGFTLPAISNPLPPVNGNNPDIITSNNSGIDLAQNNTVRGLDIGNTGTGAGISGSTVGNLTVSESQITGTGQAIDINGGALTVTFDSLSSNGSAAEGIVLNNVTGSFAVSGGTTISSSTDTGIDITSSPTATFTFADLDITTTNDAGLDVDGAGTISSTSGTINTGSGTGIDISNAGLNLSFDSITVDGATDGIILDTTSGSFDVSTVDISNIQQTTADNFNMTTGRPTSLGNGNGVSLEDNTASFTINGGTFTDIADNALDIRNSSNTTLNNVTIADGGDGNTWSTGNSTIQWHGGSNLTLNNVNISNIGDNVAQSTGGVNIQDSGIKAYDVSGDLDIVDSVFNTATGYVFANGSAGSEDRAVELDNDTGTDMDVTVTGSTFQNFDFQGLNLRHIGGSLDAIIGGPNAGDPNTFQNINGAAVDTGPSGAASSGNVHGLLVENNQFTTVGIGVSVFSGRGTAIGGVSGTHATITDNTINGTTSDAIRLNGFGSGSLGNPAVFRASVTDNTIDGVANQLAGNGGGSTFFVAAEDGADSDVTINGNTATGGNSGGSNSQSPLTTQVQRAGDLDMIFTNNGFSNMPGAVNGFGVWFSNGAGAPSSHTVQFGGNDWEASLVVLATRS